ncbi:hypothetical protein PGT21_018959 [Puccinia graminis f. sp. tritici]|uniref:Uncharacterized protein n=1 Tax=Puccinia graminis f. sp. tritici TaxID=56615 RepID=A0A5B0MLV2_PUCGR|nr:hypothetical protein PGT21_018959 [Puccinia graminis f. sp. tritici]
MFCESFVKLLETIAKLFHNSFGIVAKLGFTIFPKELYYAIFSAILTNIFRKSCGKGLQSRSQGTA